MIRYILGRLTGMVFVLLLLAAIMFVLSRLSLVDEAKQYLGPHVSQAARQRFNHRYWLDRPFPLQYIHYLAGLAHGDLQTSIRTHRPVISDLAQYLPATLELAACGMSLAVLLALCLAFVSLASWHGSHIIRFAIIGAASVPIFLLGIGGVLLFYARLHWLPAAGEVSALNLPSGPTRFLLVDSLLAGRPALFLDAARHLILPSLCVALGPAVAIGRVLASSLAASLESEYALTARAKGLSARQILLRHALRNSLGPALAMTALQSGAILAGVVIVEYMFAWPGVGSYMAQSIPVGDFPGVAGVTIMAAAVYVILNALADIAQAAADPRIRSAPARSASLRQVARRVRG